VTIVVIRVYRVKRTLLHVLRTLCYAPNMLLNVKLPQKCRNEYFSLYRTLYQVPKVSTIESSTVHVLG